MSPFTHAIRSAVSGAIAVMGFVVAGSASPGTIHQLQWSDLVPQTDASLSEQGALTPLFDGQAISLTGYLLPSDREGDLVYTFMLVSRPGACSHNAQPPANQVIRVVPATPYRLRSNYEPVTVAGKLSSGLEKTQMFILDGPAVIQSGYSIHRAEVRPLKNAPASGRSFQSNPWQSLTHGKDGASPQPLPDVPDSLSRTR
ncbi:DUF3299 domain-containing protein [Nitratireductor sp. GISD-1A_MAKvit]|uniref:DUF3299 domain-containing protein n=1 Tax=Nitratireductor sp. GISD-1A_MAKvit TaxID=3234198 RepID=UPI003465A87B